MPALHEVPALLQIAFVVCLAYMLSLSALVFTMLVVAAIESRHRGHERDAEDYESLAGSRFTIPVSIVAPAFDEETMILSTARSLLAQTYPEFEVILVDDGSRDGTLEVLKREFDLEPREVFFRNDLPSKPIRMLYRSRREPRLVVVVKENGGKADALNCGINLAKYRYLCCVDGDTVYAPDALLTGMSLVVKDPGTIVGAASLFGISREPERPDRSGGHDRSLDRHLLSSFQHVDMMRSFLASRLAWSRLGVMLCNPGGFALWRRDVVVEVGGFSRDFSCEDIEMTFRVHERFLKSERPYRILSLPQMVASTEGPDNASALVSQRARWQRVTLETVWHYRRMFLRPRYGAVGMIGFPYFVFFEALAPFMQTLSFVVLAISAYLGLMQWPLYAALVGAMLFANALPTTVAVLLHDATYRDYSLRDVIRMLLLGPLEFLLFRPILIYAGLKGMWQFLRGEKGWNKFQRNVRVA